MFKFRHLRFTHPEAELRAVAKRLASGNYSDSPGDFTADELDYILLVKQHRAF